jgi:hypothetical protein
MNAAYGKILDGADIDQTSPPWTCRRISCSSGSVGRDARAGVAIVWCVAPRRSFFAFLFSGTVFSAGRARLR